LNTHISAVMKKFISSHPDWLTEVRLPAYAPDLNPAEGVWANMKNGLGNLGRSSPSTPAITTSTGPTNPASNDRPTTTTTSALRRTCQSSGGRSSVA
jgi:transposase